MKLLTDVNGDEVSLVNRAANKRRFLLLKGDKSMDGDLSDILETPYEREGALIDELRKDGVENELVEKAVVAAVRLLKGVEGEFSPEMVEKLGTELYPRNNPPLNTTSVDSPGDLIGDGDGADKDGGASGPTRDGSGTDGELSGTASGAKVAEDDDVEMAKRDIDTSDRKNLASSGKALPDGSFPIENKEDLGNAIKLAGKAKDLGKAKAFIIRRARALGATSMLPDSWNVSKEDTSDEDDPVIETERGTVETHAVPIQKEDGSWDLSGVPDESRPFFEAMIQKADATASELEKAKEQLAKSDDTLLTRSMLEKAARLNHVAPADDLAPILKEASQKLDPESFEKLEQMLAAVEERVSKGELFEEMGRTGYGASKPTTSGAYEQILAKAAELVEKSGDLSQEAAFDRALQQNPELYSQYMFENGMGV